MKQILLRKGQVTVEDVPAPMEHAQNVLVEVSRSLISTGTEVSSVQQSSGSLLEKARQPESIVKVIQSVRVRGFAKTFALIQQSLDDSKPLGYSCAGTVIAVGKEVKNFRVGDRVACAGANMANHAEVVSVPENLVAKIPHGVTDKCASFVALGAIALQGVRRAEIRLGETVCVVGLGLLGQLTVQLLVASGCRVVGVDVDANRVDKARKFGLEEGATSIDALASTLSAMTHGHGVDVTILTAATESSVPTQKAFEITRKKGRIVVVGAVGLTLTRSPFYEKEQDFLISCSYGPGRYDPQYELDGQDYPYAYVRWTENRNMGAFLDLVASGKVRVDDLVDQEMPLEKADEAYQLLQTTEAPKPLAVVLTYDQTQLSFVKTAPLVRRSDPARVPGKIRLGLIGAGQFTKSTHLPNLGLLEEKFDIVGVATAHSATAHTMGRQLKAGLVSSDPKEIIQDSKVDAVLIATRHNTHAVLAQEALHAGKHVFLEKPLALTEEELVNLEKTVHGLSTCPVFMVGFNRRFSPLADKLKAQLAHRRSPLMATYRVNAGALPATHWTKATEGGGRLRGEACHMIDFLRYIVQSPLKSVQIEGISPSDQSPLRPDENFSAHFAYEDGSLCTLVYTALGNNQLPKERLEVHWEGSSLILDDFRSLHYYDGSTDVNLSRPDKGHLQALQTFANSIQIGLSFPIPWDELVETTRACLMLDAEIWGRLP